MIVKELFEKLDKKDIVDAYMFRHGYCSESFKSKERTMLENIETQRKERMLVEEMIDNIRNHDIDASLSHMVLFVFPSVSIFWDERDEKGVDSHVVDSNDARAKIKDKNWQNKDDSRVEGYAYEFETRTDVLSYTVAKTSLERMDPLEITSEILNEMSFFGYEEASHDETVEKELATLNERVEEIKEREEKGEPIGIPHEDVFASLEKSIYDSFKTDEERKHYEIEKKYEKELEPIEHEYAMRMSKHYCEIIEDYYKAEFLDT